MHNKNWTMLKILTEMLRSTQTFANLQHIHRVVTYFVTTARDSTLAGLDALRGEKRQNSISLSRHETLAWC